MGPPFGLTEEALVAAETESDPDSLGAAQRMRQRFGPDLAAAALTQVALRRKARTKFGDAAKGMFFTRDGLEQATRPAVAAHHARRFEEAGVAGVMDLGCGIGADAMAFLDAGLRVWGMELDPGTAAVAAANLAGVAATKPSPASYEVVVGDAETQASDTPDEETGEWGWFADPARRDRTGRVWRVSDFTPSWPFVLRLLAGDRVAGVKLGPALPHADIPAGVEAEWVSHAGSTVEAALWTGVGTLAGRRRATVLDAPGGPATLLVEPAELVDPVVGPIGRYVYEPAGAAIRAGAIPLLAAQLAASLIDPKIAYLSSDRLTATPFATAYEVTDRLPHNERVLRGWLRERDVGTLEIKQRGIDLDPARLRRRLAPHGSASATFLITRTPKGAAVLVVRRVPIV